MITLTRLNGATFALNDQLVERIEANPDTVVVLVDGKKFIVSEPVSDVIEQIRQARADVAIRAAMVEVVETPGPDLRLINGAHQHSTSRLSSTKDDNADDHDDHDADVMAFDDSLHTAHPPGEHKPGNAKEGNSWIQ